MARHDQGSPCRGLVGILREGILPWRSRLHADLPRTNIRPPDGPPASVIKQARSRGGLARRFLAPSTESASSVADELDTLRTEANDYDGFNLLLIRLKKHADGTGDTEASILFNQPQTQVHPVGRRARVPRAVQLVA